MATPHTRLAVLPFENLGDSTDAYFADGIADEVRGKLAVVSGLEVIARSSSSRYRGEDKSPQEIAQDLDVRYLLTGTVRWEKRPGEALRVRVSPELVDARTGTTRWQKSFDAALTDVFEIQGQIAGDVADALNLALAEARIRWMERDPTWSQSLQAVRAGLGREASMVVVRDTWSKFAGISFVAALVVSTVVLLLG